ncbi:hypothetical protein BK133_18685 [Paenibacillus sp. FSL H8-0548]|uniref:type II TA system antitoxin MqsA family protein n=1 Tax=Paenibacillus sp. FSL H8-0548 TaxID=1920422 RepID=UPI00096F6BA8|nr:type II TA system antitoxin MqsA family protein [Paenibacillus sp. FSL H8-0548]OMF28679.1 hypothetical protein BK133_18685 [Paenibacillus sp. FSL H8-0548]
MTKRIRYCNECRCEREVQIKEREALLTYGDESFSVIEVFAACMACGQEVSDEELDSLTLRRLQQAYELKHTYHAEGIKKIRLYFGFTQPVFAKILNIGLSTLKRYERGGSSPDVTQMGIFKLLKYAPENMLKFYETNLLNLLPSEKEIVEKRFLELFGESEYERSCYHLFETIYKPFENSISNGDVHFHTNKFLNMILFFTQHGVLKTKLMKLLWYSDFLHFKRFQSSISGVTYIHKPYGPVPKEYEAVLAYMESSGQIAILVEEGDDGYTRISITSQRQLQDEWFSPAEFQTLSEIVTYFESFGSREISDYAHRTSAWLETVDDQIIEYSYAGSIQLQ